MNKTGSTMKKVAIAGAGAAGIGIAALVARKAFLNAVALPESIFHNLGEKGSFKHGVEQDLFKGMALTDSFKSHNGIGDGIVLESKGNKKSVIAESVENPHIEAKKFPVHESGNREKGALTGSFLKNNSITNNID